MLKIVLLAVPGARSRGESHSPAVPDAGCACPDEPDNGDLGWIYRLGY